MDTSLRVGAHHRNALIVCDMQPDLLRSLDAEIRHALLDYVRIAIDACRKASWFIVFTGVKFSSGYAEVSEQHRVYGALKRLNAKLGDGGVHWFLDGYSGTGIDPSISPMDQDVIVWRNQHMPPNELADVLASREVTECAVVGIKAGYTIQATCQFLCDKGISVSVIREAIQDDDSSRLVAVLQHLLPIYAHVTGLSELVDQAVGSENYNLREGIITSNSKTVRYCCDCFRGGHASIYMAHLLKQADWQAYPKQEWYTDFTKIYFCPLGKAIIQFCDEPQFSQICMYIKGRDWLDEKDKLIKIADEFIPASFLIQRREWVGEKQPDFRSEDGKAKGPWFVKESDKNGGRSVRVCHSLSDVMDMTEPDGYYVVQNHVIDPLLTDDGHKCHVKLYNLLFDKDGIWELYTYSDAFQSISANPWSREDISEDTQITTKRHRRLGVCDATIEGWTNAGKWSHVYAKLQDVVLRVIQRAIEEGKLRNRPGKHQFEIFSADFMLDKAGHAWLIEFNFSPVLYDPMVASTENLTTPGLRSYHNEYKRRGEAATVNDHKMIRDVVAKVFYPDKELTESNWDLLVQLQGVPAGGI